MTEPRTVLEIASRAQAVYCTKCAAHSWDACRGEEPGMHLARFWRARDMGLITAGDLDFVFDKAGLTPLFDKKIPFEES